MGPRTITGEHLAPPPVVFYDIPAAGFGDPISSANPPAVVRWRLPLADNHGCCIAQACTPFLVALMGPLRYRVGDRNGDAVRIASEVAAAIHAALINGTASKVLTISEERVMEVFRGPTGRAPSLLALVGAEIAVAFAGILNEWCSETFATRLLCTWQGHTLTLLDKKVGGTGVDALRPIGLASILQRTAAMCMLKTIGDDMFRHILNGCTDTKEQH